MTDTLEDLGVLVQINDTMIPAMNIQVENVPGYIPNMGVPGADPTWYGVYFEVAFENGALWVVEQKPNEDDPDAIIVTEYDRWDLRTKADDARMDDPDYGRSFETWDEFLVFYKEMARN